MGQKLLLSCRQLGRSHTGYKDAPLKAAQDSLGNARVHFVGLFLQVRDEGADRLDDGNDQRAERRGARVIPHRGDDAGNDGSVPGVGFVAAKVPLGNFSW